jgi:benzoate-CoA ligase
MSGEFMSISRHQDFLGKHFNFAEFIRTTNLNRLSKVAYIDDHGQLTYSELFDQMARLGSALIASGVRREERILLLMQDCNEWPISFLGAMSAGIVPVAVNTLLTAEDYAYMLENSRSQTVLVSDNLIGTLSKAIEIIKKDAAHKSPVSEIKSIIVPSGNPQTLKAFQDNHPEILVLDFSNFIESASPIEFANTAPDDPGFWLYSSGSTGKPKGAVHTHANPYWTAQLYSGPILEIQEDDICFSAAKLFFAYGLGNGLSFPLSVGATTILMAERATPDAVFKRFVELKPTIFFGAPTGYNGMLASQDLPPKNQVALRMCSSAGEALPREIGERWTKHFDCEIIDGLGSTEMLHIFLSNRPGDVKYGTSGKPVDGYELEIRGEDGLVVGDGEIGDLYVKGPSAATMYWNNREKSRETFQGAWTKSGDKYIRDKDGYYTYSGRNDDMLKISGIYVSPFEVEGTLIQHPAVLESAVIGVLDEAGLVKTKAFVVLKKDSQVSKEELQAFVKERLAPYKYPRIIDFVTELPKTATGKIQRFKLREQEIKVN